LLEYYAEQGRRIAVSKVTAKYQVSVPKALADQYRIAPGDDLVWEAAGEALRVRLAEPRAADAVDGRERLRLFDAATRRQAVRQSGRTLRAPTDRGWTRDELYDRDARAR
jgi:bifunctional DNA-binding transcriptional regulator/antitoxin component of YhaV-PrlF toxin-antitoxin module